MNKHLFLTLCLVFVWTVATLFCTSVLQASTIHVPADSVTIQAGINGAVDGDTVLVADGTYTGDGNQDIDFLGKAIVVMSENGPESCVIEPESSPFGNGHRGFYFHSGEDATSVLEGFTIQHGSVGQYSPSSPFGGGIHCSSSSPTIRGNTISECGSGFMGQGGGIYCINSSAVIIGNTITGNGAGGYWEFPGGNGGGICCRENSSPIISGNTITENVVSCFGEGFPVYGAGIFCADYSSPIIIGNTIAGNHRPSGEMSGICYGGGIFCAENSSPIIIGNTITGNTADSSYAGGGGIFCWGSSSPIVMNSIVWGNSPDQIHGIHTVTYSNIQGGYPGEGNIDEDPMFVQPDTSMYTDYRLLWGSPCIDTGHPDSLDADGTRSDMGAHYFNQDDYLTLYLTPDKTEVAPGGQLGVTYTLINRWSQSEPFWGLTQVILPGGNPFNLIGPDQFTLPAKTTIQRHFNHNVPAGAPWGQYEYRTQIGSSPSTLYDEDRFMFSVVE